MGLLCSGWHHGFLPFSPLPQQGDVVDSHTMASTLSQVLDRIRESTKGYPESVKGHRFEILCKRFLENEPVYKERFSKVWLWIDWPYRGKVQDQGIDLVAQEAATGGYCAIQCKFYDPSHTMDLEDVSTFFATASSMWQTGQGSQSFESGIIIATTDRWNEKITRTIEKQVKPFAYLGLSDLSEATVDWERLEQGASDVLPPKYDPRPHQEEAIADVLKGFETHDRGKLIMACGTGKTFTSLRLAERFTGGKGCVLFLAPSIALVAQSLREWLNQTRCAMHPIAVCSDSGAASPDPDTADLSSRALPAPSTTDPVRIAENYRLFADSHLTVIFSTYQSLDKVHEAQEAGALPRFDLIICDEAHRTTGVALKKEEGGYDESLFMRVHDKEYIKGNKRLYMTATPRIYDVSAKAKADSADALLASMDDLNTYGPELHRLPFSRAVSRGLLADYKVLVLCVDEAAVRETFAEELSHGESGLQLDEAVKLIGCYNGLRKKMVRVVHQADPSAASPDAGYDPSEPDVPLEDPAEDDHVRMHRAVAFAGTIAESQKIKKSWEIMVDRIRETEKGSPDFMPCDVDHIDGTMDMKERSALLAKLKEPVGPDGECRILSNARCLSEGVDVPALDAVLFLAPRRSQVDVVQSVGRVMRKVPGKKYGYIILPIGVTADDDPNAVLDNEEKYKTVWHVLQALRAHDDRFNAMINQIELNRGRGPIDVAVTPPSPLPPHGGPGGGQGGGGEGSGATTQGPVLPLFHLEEWKDAIYAKLVKKCGTRRYWEDWAADVAGIAEAQMARINAMLDAGKLKSDFELFLKGLQENIQPNISRADAVEMLAQQMITRPVFNALFSRYKFSEQNPVARTMNQMLDLIMQDTPPEEAKKLEKFYDSVHERAKGVDNAAGRQQVIVELYEKFFTKAFPRMADKLGIVYTPVEVVDFIVRSVHEVLKREFGVPEGLGGEGVKILDPFTGTGTFIVRAIQSGLIRRKDLPRKYRDELFACEIVLLAYYIACVNIEVAYHGVMKAAEYEPFPGICLTDTFRMEENSARDQDLFKNFEDNGERLKRLCRQPIKVIFGNPPYSVGQESANDNNQNEAYPRLDARIAETYAAEAQATNKNSLYDSYIRAFRWASDRIGDSGIVAFVTNGAYIDNNAMAGFRKSIMKEFSAIYCFNLRGNQRTSGELSRKEGGKIFGSGSRTPIAITILVKQKDHLKGIPAKLSYHDIGDYLSREEKLRMIKDFRSIQGLPWLHPTPDEHGDWINQRTKGYSSFMPLGDKAAKGKADARAVFSVFSNGLKTNRDSWCYNFSEASLSENIKRSIEFFNAQSREFAALSGVKVEDFIDYDPTKFSWGRQQKKDLEARKLYSYCSDSLRIALYRPYCKQVGYFNKLLNDMVYQLPKIFPERQHENLVIQATGVGSTKSFSCLITKQMPDLENVSKGQCFPFYWYEKKEGYLDFGEGDTTDGYIRHHAITEFALEHFRNVYGDPKINREAIFYYVYGLLHSPEYRERFANDLRKELPRIPFAADFWAFSKAGRELADWHLNYETVEPYPVKEESTGNFTVQKMRFPKKGQKDTIIYNRFTVLSEIPLEAYDYVVNGKSAIEWIMERYAVTTDKNSGIVNDPNDWCREHNNPRYIIDLLKRIIRVSLETNRIVASLPPIQEKN